MRRAVALVAILVAASTSASTCDNQDLSGRFVLRLDPGQQAVVRAFSQPYIGRLTLDFGLTNTGEQDAVFDISVQAQTSGDEDAQACDNGVRTRPRELQAAVLGDDGFAVAPDDVETLRDEDRSHLVLLPADDDAGLIDVRMRTTSSYRLYVSAPAEAVELIDTDGDPIEVVSLGAPECDLFDTVIEYEVTDGTYALRVYQDGLTVLLAESCSSVRTVPRTCPGAVSGVHARDPIPLEPGAFVSGRIESTSLGVGNQAVVALECAASTPGCAGEMELFFLVQQLECRRDTDCNNVEACTEDGYCRRVRARGCSASTRLGSSSPTWVLGLMVILARRRR